MSLEPIDLLRRGYIEEEDVEEVEEDVI